jgi:hypothetical protein
MRQVQFVLFTPKVTLRLRSGRAPDTKGSDILNSELRALRITIVQSLRSLRKFSGHCSYVAVLNEKIRPHHEVHEGHEGFRIFQTPNFVIFVSFVVNIFLPIWLRRSRARAFVVNPVLCFLVAALRHD